MVDFLLFVVFFIGVPWLIYNHFKNKSTIKKQLKFFAEQLATQLSKINYEHTDGKTGIWVSTTDEKIAVFVDGKSKIYDFSEIREWEVKYFRSNYNGKSMTEAYKHGAEASDRSGLFITAKDIENPIWRIEMHDEKKQSQWMEILRQSINHDR